MKLAPYLKYRPSGMEWLGDVPEHWEMSRLGRITKARCDGPFGSGLKAEHYSDTGVRVVRLQNIRFARFDDSDKAYIDPIYYQRLGDHDVNPGDLLIAGLGDDSYPVGRACVAPLSLGPALVKADCFRFRIDTQKADPAYLAFLLSVEAMALRGAQATGTTRSRMNLAVTAGRSITLPPLPEQRAIANFLDRETARFAALVAKKRTLIERLEEKRAALLLRTVTRGLPPDAARVAGLDPHPKLKPSGIGWLGEVPEHWEGGNLRRFATMKTGHTPSRNEPSYWVDCDIPWFTLADVWQLRDGKQTYLGQTKERISGLGLANSAAELLPAGTVVFSRTASIGFSGIMRQPMATSQDFWNWIPGPKLLSEFLLLQFRAMWQEFEKLTMGSTHQTIYQSDAARLRICVPPVDEQRAIVRFLREETTKIDVLVGKVEAAIERLIEYRAAVITAAVTGKIDVQRVDAALRAAADDADPARIEA